MMSLVFAAAALMGQWGVPGAMWLAGISSVIWLGTFLIALPAAGLVLTVAFPVTRKLTRPARIICLLAGATAGLMLAPIASYGRGVVTWLQLFAFAAVGIVVAGAYVATGLRLARDRTVRKPTGRNILEEEAGAAAGLA